MTSTQGPQDEQAHDVLAAEAFAVPAADPALHQVDLPDDPSGISEAHDILAAEEFAMPAPSGRAGSGQIRRAQGRRGGLAAAVVGLLVALVRRRRRA
jgi:hypothetical protein